MTNPSATTTGTAHESETRKRVDELRPDETNRRLHPERNLGMVRDSLRAVGAARSIVIDEHDVVLAGNGVTQAAQAAGITHVRIVEASGDELIAVRRTGLSDEQKRALAMYDNRTAELATWNAPQLRLDHDAGLDLQPFFFDQELQVVLAKNAVGKPGHTDPDDVPEKKPTDIQPGDLFELGGHRLLCGDATNGEHVARLVAAGSAPFLMVTDPPYGVDYDPEWRNDGVLDHGVAPGRRTGTVANDDRADWREAWALFAGDVVYVWHDWMTSDVTKAGLVAAGIELRYHLVWAKTNPVISRGHYRGQHETCWYGVRKQRSAQWIGGHSQSTLWSISGKSADTDTNHGTQKPVECMARPMRNHGALGDVVYDPFVGSGTSIIAAEQFDRRCLALELTPTYCQVVIDRWEAFTQQRAHKVGEAVR